MTRERNHAWTTGFYRAEARGTTRRSYATRYLDEDRMKTTLTPFMLLAGIGLVLSIIVHISALLGIRSPFDEISWLLHVGIFVVWVPAVIVTNRQVKDFKRTEFWKAALRGCPKWMKNLTYSFFGYAILNFILSLILDVGTGGSKGTSGGAPSNVYRGFSGHWMAFYSAAMALLYSAFHTEEHDATRQCPMGHLVSASSVSCEECGSRTIGTPRIR